VQPLLGLRVQINQLVLQFKECKMLPSRLKPNGDCTVLWFGVHSAKGSSNMDFIGVFSQQVICRVMNALLLFCVPKKVTKKGHQRSQLERFFVAQPSPTLAKIFPVRSFVGSQPHFENPVSRI
jgi:hypothetical protein